VKNWLEQHDRWLLIFDNADDLSLVDEFLPAGSSGHILFTTRAHVMSGRAQRVEVEEMDAEEGALFLLRRTTMLARDAPLSSVSEAVRTAASAIVDAVDGLPLALDQAGAYIEETGCGLSRYLKLYQMQRKELHRRRSKRSTDHPEPVATTWSLSFEKVEEANPYAAELLRFCAFLHPDAIPEEFITEGASYLSPVLQSLASDPMKLDEAVGELLNYSLVGRHPETRSVSMHRLVQAVLKDEMDQHIQEQWAERTVGVVDHLFPFGTTDTWDLCQRYLPHAILCAAYIERWRMFSSESAGLLHKAASYLDDRAQYREAELLYQRALAIYEQVLGVDHLGTANCLNNLASLYAGQGKDEQAERLYQRALAIRERVLGAEHPDTVRVLGNYAELLKKMGREGEAAGLEARVEAIRARVRGSEEGK